MQDNVIVRLFKSINIKKEDVEGVQVIPPGRPKKILSGLKRE